MNTQELKKFLVYLLFPIVSVLYLQILPIFHPLALRFQLFALDLPKLVETLVGELRALLIVVALLVIVPLQLLECHLVLSQVAGLVEAIQVVLF